MQDIQEQIDALNKRLDDYQMSSTLDQDFESAIRERLGYDSAFIKQATSTYGTQNITVPAGGSTFAVPAQPTGTITISIKGVTYNIPYQ